MPIPRVIHQIWMNPAENGTDKPMPAKLKKMTEQWQALAQQQGYEYYLWDGPSMRAFVKEKEPAFYKTYCAYDVWIKRCDAFRYVLLYHLGGVYVDADAEPTGDLSSHLAQHRAIILRSKADWITNSFMASESKHAFFAHCIEQLYSSSEQTMIFDATGPYFLRDCYNSYKGSDAVSELPEAAIPFCHHSAKTWVLLQVEMVAEKLEIYVLYFMLIFIVGCAAVLLFKLFC